MDSVVPCTRPGCGGKLEIEPGRTATGLSCPRCGHPLAVPNAPGSEASWTLPPSAAEQAALDTGSLNNDSTRGSNAPASSWATIASAPARADGTTDHVPAGGDENSTLSPDPTGRKTTPYVPLPDPDLPERVSRFAVRQLLGEGAFGRVYRAYDEQLDREVAVKVAKAETLNSRHRVERFLREARTAAQLQHPHIVPLFDAGKDGDQYYIATAFVTGRTLEGTLEAGRPDARLTATIIRSLADALAYAHEQGIVHRDVKPANVMIDEKGQPQLMDFGLAARSDESAEKLTHDGTVMGTPMYMSPEQAAGRTAEIGPASDQYSLGVVFYEMLCGGPPFTGAMHAVMAKHRDEEPAAPRKHLPGMSRDLETICLKTLAKNPGERYTGCRELAEDLRRFLDDEPIRARKAGLGERAVKWARRNKAMAGLAGVGAFALAAVIAFLIVYSQNQTQKLDLSNAEVKKLRGEETAREFIAKSLISARQNEAAARWTRADRDLAEALATLDAQPDLKADDLRAEILSRRVAVGRKIEEQLREGRAKTRLAAFRPLYDEVLLNATGATSLDLAVSRAKIRAFAEKALAIYGISLIPDQPPPFAEERSSLAADDFARLKEDCYGLLLLWAGAESAAPVKPESPKDEKKRGAQALERLERVAGFGKEQGVDTRAFHRQKARYVALATGKPFDPAALGPAAPRVPTGTLDWFLEGLDAYGANQIDAADKACGEALKRPGGHYWAGYVRALCRIREARWGEAKNDLTVCVNARPEDPWPRVMRGLCESELGFRHASRPREEKEAAAEFKAAEGDFDTVLKKERDPLIRYVGLANRGVLNIHRKRYDEAVDDLRDAVKVDPNALQAHVNLSQALKRLKQWDAALMALNDAIRLAPGFAALYENRAEIHLSRMNRPAARADFERAIALEGDTRTERHASNLVEVGRLLHREKKYPDALAAFDRALRLMPGYVVTQRFRAETLLALDRTDDAAQALDAYLAKTKVVPAEVYQARGIIHAGAGQQPAAIDMYSAALRIDPRDTKTRGYRAWTYLSIHAPRLALADFEAWLRDAPTNADALIGRASARVRLEQLDAAVGDAVAAEKEGPLTDRLLFNLACVYAQAAVLAESDRSPQNARGARQAAYEQKAAQFLRRTLEEMPAEKRAKFWRGQVMTDPALVSLRRGKMFVQLGKDFGQIGS